ncbi:hypothetical protein G5I_00077 [Acromyrmex echinatior]|uniref:Histone-lysine N-methyltransferase SETMAR n=1 Tax=Acromyrmex echinatior TaxID=103372 RepID=F4W3X6_ACREC|nr:hypothetical protein G5I_00077 [Acromyrmex echinatior]
MDQTTTKTRSDAHSIANVPSRGNIGTELPPPPPPLSAGSVRCTATQFQKEILKQPIYSPDLSPCDFYIFADLKRNLCNSAEECLFYPKEFYEQERYLLFGFTMEEESYRQP